MCRPKPIVSTLKGFVRTPNATLKLLPMDTLVTKQPLLTQLRPPPSTTISENWTRLIRKSSVVSHGLPYLSLTKMLGSQSYSG